MSVRKADQIIRALRAQILSGALPRGAQLPIYDALMETFEVSRPTVARAVTTLRDQGLVEARGTRGVFVAEVLPHEARTVWVTGEYPGHPDWTTFLATFLDLIDAGETGLPGEVEALTGVDGRPNNPAYQRLCELVRDEAALGVFVMSSPVTRRLPILEHPNLPRAAIWTPVPHATCVELAFDALIDRACQRLVERGRRVAVLSPHQANLDAAVARLEAHGTRPGAHPGSTWALPTTPVGCGAIVRLLMERPDRPDAIFVTDDNLIPPLVEGCEAAGVRPGVDVYVLGHCNWPRPVGVDAGVEHIGFDVREILATGRGAMQATRRGEDVSGRRLVHPRFADEPFEIPRG